MGKVISVMAFLILGSLGLLSSTYTDPSAIWLATTSAEYNMLRAGLMFVLLILIVTHPPRNILFRVFVSVSTVYLSVWSIGGLLDSTVGLLDAASFIITSIALAIAALEYAPVNERQIMSPARKEFLRQQASH